MHYAEDMEQVNTQIAEKLTHYQLPKELKAHLVKTYQWSENFADQVLKEYWRYIQILAMTQETLIPPQVIAQACQAHQNTDKKSWQELNVVLVKPLNFEFHHQNKTEKNLRLYLKTLNRYQQFFSEPPPESIWEDPMREKIDQNKRLLTIIPIASLLILIFAFFNKANMILSFMAVLSFGGLAYLYINGKNDKLKEMRQISVEDNDLSTDNNFTR